jgi:hypothetical protein
MRSPNSGRAPESATTPHNCRRMPLGASTCQRQPTIKIIIIVQEFLYRNQTPHNRNNNYRTQIVISIPSFALRPLLGELPLRFSTSADLDDLASFSKFGSYYVERSLRCNRTRLSRSLDGPPRDQLLLLEKFQHELNCPGPFGARSADAVSLDLAHVGVSRVAEG